MCNPKPMNLKLAEDYWARGASHMLSLEALIERGRSDGVRPHMADIDQSIFNGPYAASIHLLAGYSLELLLKSACYLHGGDEARLRSRDVGHDLTATLDEAEALGYVTEVPRVRWIAETLREPHLNHQFRYGGAEEVLMPDLEYTMAALKGLADELHARIESAARK